MNKSECEEIVLMQYALFNQALYSADKKAVFLAWFAMLEGLEFEETRAAVVACSSEEKYMPTAGAICRQVKMSRQRIPPPTPHQFWAYIQAVVNNHRAGITGNIRKETAEHPAAVQTIKDIGADVIFGLHTNGDRTWALEAYTENLKKFLANA